MKLLSVNSNVQREKLCHELNGQKNEKEVGREGESVSTANEYLNSISMNEYLKRQGLAMELNDVQDFQFPNPSL